MIQRTFLYISVCLAAAQAFHVASLQNYNSQRIIQRSAFGLMATSTTNPDEWELPDEAPEGGRQRRSEDLDEEIESVEDYYNKVQTNNGKFVQGDELHLLRTEVIQMRNDLDQARASGDSRKVLELEHKILKSQNRDAEFVYAVSLERMQTAKSMGDLEQANLLHEEAMEARNALPHLNLDGLWVGRYGEHGYEMVNVTYVGDVLYAYKATGDANVPKGELSFKVDLSPLTPRPTTLDPIELGEYASKQWGTKYLNRYSGVGQVAGEGYQNPQFIEGQLIMVNEYFSFAWVPIGHQVFFGRPSADLVLKLLKETNTNTDKARSHLMRCLEETEILEEESEESTIVEGNIYAQEGCFE